MREASQLPQRGPTDVDDAPYTCMLIKNLTMMIYDVNQNFYKMMHFCP